MKMHPLIIQHFAIVGLSKVGILGRAPLSRDGRMESRLRRRRGPPWRGYLACGGGGGSSIVFIGSIM